MSINDNTRLSVLQTGAVRHTIGSENMTSRVALWDFETEPNCQPKIKISLLLCTHYVTYFMNYVSKACDGCASVHMKQLYSLRKRAVKFLMPIPNII